MNSCTLNHRVKRIQACLNEEPCTFSKDINKESRNPLQNHWANFKKTWHKSSLGEGVQFFTNKRKNLLFLINKTFFSFNQYNHSFSQMWLMIRTVSQVSDFPHVPLVFRIIQGWVYFRCCYMEDLFNNNIVEIHWQFLKSFSGVKFVQLKNHSCLIGKMNV